MRSGECRIKKIEGMRMKIVTEGSIAIANAVKMCRPRVIPMYPITPQTHIVQELARMINNGELDAQMIHVESEHSALSAALGSQTAGVRSFTATSSQGFALMFEILPIVAGLRLPVVMSVANRALSAPINIWNDHSDSVSARDQGWIQIYSEDAQDALDTAIMSFRIAEHKDVLLPAMPCIDGYTLSHMYEPVEIPTQEEVDAFVPEYKPVDFLDVENPKSFGNIGMPDVFMEFKKQQQDAFENSVKVIKNVNKEFGKKFGRSYGDGLLQLHKMEDAEFAIIGMGTLCATAKEVVDRLRKNKVNAGLIQLRCLRPFPKAELKAVVKNLKGLIVIDRHFSLGYEGALYTDVKSALYEYAGGLKINSYIAGLGGRDIKAKHIEKTFRDIIEGKDGGWLF